MPAKLGRKEIEKRRVAVLEVENWNLKHRVGTPVDVTLDSGKIQRTSTRTEAVVSQAGYAVIWLENIIGYYLLSRVTAIPQV